MELQLDALKMGAEVLLGSAQNIDKLMRHREKHYVGLLFRRRLSRGQKGSAGGPNDLLCLIQINQALVSDRAAQKKYIITRAGKFEGRPNGVRDNEDRLHVGFQVLG